MNNPRKCPLCDKPVKSDLPNDPDLSVYHVECAHRALAERRKMMADGNKRKA